MSRNNNAFLKGTISLSLSVIITKILGVSFKVPLSYVLGDEGMGYFNTAYAIYGFFYILCTAGVPKSITLLLAENRVADPKKDDYGILYSGLKLFTKIGVIASLLNIICAPVFARLVGNYYAYHSIISVAPSILFVSLSGVLRGYLNSCEKLTEIAISQLIEGAIKLFLGLSLAFIGVRLGASIYSISALAIFGISVGSVVSFIYMYIKAFCYKSNKNTRQNCITVQKDINRKIIKNALPIALSSSLLNLSSTLDLTIIIKRLIDTGVSEKYANSIYGNYTTLAVPMFNLVISVLTPIATSFMPKLSVLSAKNDRNEFSLTLNRLLTVTLLISVPASISFCLYSFDLLDVLFSVQSAAVGAESLIFLSIGLCFLSTLTVTNTALESKGKISSTVISLMFGCVVKIVASYTLIGIRGIGILGAPLGTVLSYALSLITSLIFLEATGVRTYAVVKMIVYGFVGALTFYLPYKMIYSTVLLGSSFLSMIASLAISVVCYFSVLFAGYIFTHGTGVFNLHKKT